MGGCVARDCRLAAHVFGAGSVAVWELVGGGERRRLWMGGRLDWDARLGRLECEGGSVGGEGGSVGDARPARLRCEAGSVASVESGWSPARGRGGCGRGSA